MACVYLINNKNNKNLSYENAEEMKTFSIVDLLRAWQVP